LSDKLKEMVKEHHPLAKKDKASATAKNKIRA
jgi:hypothetical protein